jgi:hypothetical protein
LVSGWRDTSPGVRLAPPQLIASPVSRTPRNP